MYAGSKKESMLPNCSEYEDCHTTADRNHSTEKKTWIKELEGMKTTLFNSLNLGTSKG